MDDDSWSAQRGLDLTVETANPAINIILIINTTAL